MSFTVIGLWLCCLAPLISAIHIGEGNRSIQRKPQNLSQVTEKLNHIMLYRVDLAMSGIQTHGLFPFKFDN